MNWGVCQGALELLGAAPFALLRRSCSARVEAMQAPTPRPLGALVQQQCHNATASCSAPRRCQVLTLFLTMNANQFGALF